MIAYAKANPSKINYGFVPGTIGHMTTELFAKTAGIEITRVPYKGNGTAIGDLIGGHIIDDGAVDPAGDRQRQGRARCARSRSPRPSAPSSCLTCRPIAESALPGFSAAIRYGLAAPAGTPRPIIDRLSRELRAAVASDEMRERSAREGAEPIASTPEEYAAEIDAEETKWSAIVKSLNLKIE